METTSAAYTSACPCKPQVAISTTAPSSPRSPRIAIVGPCAAGKSTLALALRQLGFDARQIVQEHSFVPQMWQIMTKPDRLVFLDASYEATLARKHLNWTREEYEEQHRRLAHARSNCDIYVDTEALTPGQVLEDVLRRLNVAAPPQAAV